LNTVFTENSFKSKQKNYSGIWACSWYCWKVLGEWDLKEGDLEAF
jgi:hypothetical protein